MKMMNQSVENMDVEDDVMTDDECSDETKMGVGGTDESDSDSDSESESKKTVLATMTDQKWAGRISKSSFIPLKTLEMVQEFEKKLKEMEEEKERIEDTRLAELVAEISY